MTQPFDMSEKRDPRAVRILAKNIYREFRANGFSEQDVLSLAGELLASLEDSEIESDREAAWAVELRARIEAYERDEVTAVPVEDALAQIRAARGKAT